jgi:catechol 2,3-dioxygenase-like lactoylglutathione lyase family enzyme
LISGIDHVVIAVRELSAGVAAYETLLNTRAQPSVTNDGVEKTLIHTANTGVELMAPAASDAGADRLRAALAGGEGLKSLVFAVDDIARMHRRCERVGLAPEDIVEREGWASFRANTERTRGVRLFFLQRQAPAMTPPGVGLDHVVIRTSNPEHAAALYGARLGLDMRLDRDVGGRRLTFFRCGDTIVEIAQDAAVRDGEDQLWGLSWRVADADAARARLAGAGLDVSEVRAGMKPGTRVFTVRDGTCGTPTLMIEPAKRD